MIRLRPLSVLMALLAWASVCPGLAQDAAGPTPEFKEVYDLIRTHLSGVSEAELNQAAVRGLVSALSPRVSFVSGSPPPSASAEPALLSKEWVFDGPIAYLRVGRVGEGLGQALRAGYKDLATTNRLKGLVLDLRFAEGDNYAAVPGAAELFLDKEQALLDWGEGPVKAKADSDPIQVPSAVLVNEQTAGAAEALAAVLRQSAASLILGSRTAGRATIAEVFPLKDGSRLRIATTPIRLADGTSFPAHGLEPDISVEVNLDDQRAYFADVYATLRRPGSASPSGLSASALSAGTNRPTRRPRVNEAELVRERREGQTNEAPAATGRERDADRPLVRDPVLARALDFLKGLALVRSGRS